MSEIQWKILHFFLLVFSVCLAVRNGKFQTRDAHIFRFVGCKSKNRLKRKKEPKKNGKKKKKKKKMFNENLEHFRDFP